MAVLVRYDSGDEKYAKYDCRTRREFNARFGQPSPVAELVPGGERIEAIFWRLNQLRTAGMSDMDPLHPGVICDWCRLTGRVLRPHEAEIILDMDQAYRVACRREMSTGGG